MSVSHLPACFVPNIIVLIKNCSKIFLKTSSHFKLISDCSFPSNSSFLFNFANVVKRHLVNFRSLCKANEVQGFCHFPLYSVFFFQEVFFCGHISPGSLQPHFLPPVSLPRQLFLWLDQELCFFEVFLSLSLDVSSREYFSIFNMKKCQAYSSFKSLSSSIQFI